MRSSVLFLVFNRPDTTQRVFDAIRAAKPPRLYVAADGARAGRPDEAKRCEAVRRIATAVDWPCQLTTLIRPNNLGCKRAVSSAIDWFFEHESEGVILEDDCLPDPTFFLYCDELLLKHRDDPTVMCISGDNFISDVWQPPDSYYFSMYAHIWGWASWRRAWALYDVNMPDWGDESKRGLLQQVLPGAKREQAHWMQQLNDVAHGRIDTWDLQWVYTCFKHAGLSCMPAANLISNIGFGADATHTTSPEAKLSNLPARALKLPIQHPDSVVADAAADRWTAKHVFDVSEHWFSPPRWRAAARRLLSRATMSQRG